MKEGGTGLHRTIREINLVYKGLSKKQLRSSTVQEEGLTNEGRHHLLLLHKQVHDKRGITESLHAHITKIRLTACELGVF